MQRDALWNRARADLVIASDRGHEDVVLWEHSARVAGNARRIARIPEVLSKSPDETAIVAAALYHDAGWIGRLRAGEVRREGVLLCPLSDKHRERGAEMMERSLRKLVPRPSLARASRAIQTLQKRRIHAIEGQVLTEAENLEEFGILALWATVRRHIVEGRGVQSVIDTWHRRREYSFWEARLNDAFRFEPVRAVARKRIEKLDRAMIDLEEQHLGNDLKPHVVPGLSDEVMPQAMG